MKNSGRSRVGMKLTRPFGVGVRFLLVIVGNFAVALTEMTNKTDVDLECTNDFEELMLCQLNAQNCAEYNLTLRSNSDFGESGCVFHKCETGQCCCSAQMKDLLIYLDSWTANVYKDYQITKTKVIDVIESIKPKTPTIISLRESNGNYQLKWTTNMKGYLSTQLAANVTYYKKGDPKKKFHANVDPTSADGLKYYEIIGRHLEPSTTYVVSVRSYTNWSDKYSDSSEEREFTTPVSPNIVLTVIIVSLSVFAVIITGTIFGCYVKLKNKWWDTISSPKLLIPQNHHEFLKPEPLIMSSVNVEPCIPDDCKSWLDEFPTDTCSMSTQQSSGISTGSSCLSYANTEPPDIVAGVHDALRKAFPNITTCEFVDSNKDGGLFSDPSNACGLRADDMGSGSSGFDNRTYSILIPRCQQQIMTDCSEVQSQTEMVCDSAYHPSEGDTVACAEQQVPACPLFDLLLLDPSLMPTDMSYQQCNGDSAYTGDSSLSSVSSGSNTATCDLASRVEGFDEVVDGATKLNGNKEEAMVCDENPCYGHVPAASPRFLQVDDDYQAFQNLVEQADVWFPEQRSIEKQDKYPGESFAKFPPVIPGLNNNVPGGQCVPVLQRPVFSLMSSHMPEITDSGYQCV